MGANSGAVLHIVDSLAFGGAQSILKDYFESRPDDKMLHLYALRVAPRQVNISHPNVHVDPSAARLSMLLLSGFRANQSTDVRDQTPISCRVKSLTRGHFVFTRSMVNPDRVNVLDESTSADHNLVQTGRNN